MASHLLKELKQFVDASDFEAALASCEKLIAGHGETFDDQEKFIVLSTKGHCCIQLGKIEVGEKSLIEASKIPATVPQTQKILKMLADLYERIGKWDEFARVSVKLYDIILAKGNFERAKVLGRSITDAFSKSKNLATLEDGANFINGSLKNPGVQSLEYVFHIVGSLGYILDNVDEVKAKVSAASITSVVQVSNSEQWCSPAFAMKTLYEATTRFDRLVPNNIGITSLTHRYLQCTRKSVLSGENSWKEMAEACTISFKVDPNSREVVIQYLSQCYIFGEEHVYEMLMLMVDEILTVDETNTTANYMKTLKLLQTGHFVLAKPFILRCLSFWKAQEEIRQPSELIIHDQEIIKSMCLFVIVMGFSLGEFVELSVMDTLHYVEEAIKRCEQLDNAFEIMNGRMLLMLKVCRLIGFSTVGQRIFALNEMISLITATSSSLIPQPIRNSSSADTSCRFEVCDDYPFNSDTNHLLVWMLLILLRCVESFDSAILLGERLASTSENSSCFAESEVQWCRVLKLLKSNSSRHLAEIESFSPLVYDLKFDKCIETTESNVILGNFQKLLQSSSSNPLVSQIECLVKFRMAVVMWLSGGQLKMDKKACFATLLDCAKSTPNFGEVYTYLGHYYREIQGDDDRAEKCYLRALTCYPLDAEAGYCLSKYYLERYPDGEKAQNLWESINSLTLSHCLWCLSFKAHHAMSKYNIDVAISTFQLALEIDPQNGRLWYGLGQAYALNRQNTAALRALMKSKEIIPDNCAIENLIAEMENRLCLFTESKRTFTSVLFKYPENIIALKGSAEACMAIAFTNFACGWISGASDQLSQGISSVEKAIALSDTDAKKCLFKLLGDLCRYSI